MLTGSTVVGPKEPRSNTSKQRPPQNSQQQGPEHMSTRGSSTPSKSAAILRRCTTAAFSVELLCYPICSPPVCAVPSTIEDSQHRYWTCGRRACRRTQHNPCSTTHQAARLCTQPHVVRSTRFHSARKVRWTAAGGGCGTAVKLLWLLVLRCCCTCRASAFAVLSSPVRCSPYKQQHWQESLGTASQHTAHSSRAAAGKRCWYAVSAVLST